MKQRLLVMVIALICYAGVSRGQTTFIEDGLTYSIESEEERTCGVSKCPEDKIDVVIPQEVTYNGESYKVVKIKDSSFMNCNNLESVSLPEGLIAIEVWAFWKCRNLKSINLPEGLVSIGFEAFHGCWSLSSIELPSTLTDLAQSVFSGCSSLVSFDWPDRLTSIPNNTFDGCSGLISMDIPDSVTDIGDGAFCDCSGLVSIKLPVGLTSISNVLFMECISLVSIDLPNTVTSIGRAAFSGCTSLSSIKLPDAIRTIEQLAFSGCTGLSTIELPSSLTSIETSAFSGCTGLSTIELPSSLTSIGTSAFSGCTGLSTIELPSSLTSIGASAFSGCKGLSTIELPSSLTSIEKSAFSGCTGLSSISFPKSLSSIGDYSFSGCTGLTSIDIPSSLTSIGEQAFSRCSNVITLNLEAPMTYVGRGAFWYCDSLKNIVYTNEYRNYDLCSGVFPGNIETFIYDASSIKEYPLNVFSGSISSDAILYVPNDKLEWVKNDTPWNEFKTIEALPEMSLSSEVLNLWTGNNHELILNLDKEEMPFGKLEVEWNSSDPKAIAIQGTGNTIELVPMSEGYYVISCILKWGNVWTKTLKCNVFVKETLKNLKIVAEKDTVLIGQSLILSAATDPENAFYKNYVSWKSSDETIAAVYPSTNGRALLKTFNRGSVIITAEAGSEEEGGYAHDSIEITVTQPVESIILDPAVWSGVEDETFQIQATVLPEDATDKTLAWSSSDNEIATVDNTGLVSVLKMGNCVITARSTDGSDLTAECHVSIITGVANITFDAAEVVDIYTLDGVKIKANCKKNEIEDLTPGIYLLRKGKKVEKLIIR